MNKYTSSSRSQPKTSKPKTPKTPKTPNNATSSGKRTSSTPAERSLNNWVESNAKELLKAIANWKRADMNAGDCPKTATYYQAREGTDGDLRHTLALIHKEHGPLHMHYKGCDGLARHWVAGWDTDEEIRLVQKAIVYVEMGELLPGQSPVLEKLAPSRVTQNQVTRAHPEEDGDLVESEVDSEDPDTDDAVWSCEELTENQTVYSLENSEEAEKRKQEKHQFKADWVDVPGGGTDEGEWMKPNNIPTVVKDAGRFFLEAVKKM